MSDAVVDHGNPTATPAATAPPQGQPPPASMQKPTQAPPQPPSASPPTDAPLRPTDFIQDPDDPSQVFYVGDMMKLAKSVGGLPADRLETALLMDKAMNGDQEAARKVMQKFSAAPDSAAPATPSAANPEVESLRAELNEVKTRLIEVAPVANEIVVARHSAALKTMIESVKDQVPYLAIHPEAGHEAYRELQALKAQVKQAGHDPERLTPEQQSGLIARAIHNANRTWALRASVFGVDLSKPTTKPQGQQIVAQNDQAAPSNPHGAIPARYQVAGGVITDAAGNRYRQNPAGGGLELIPGDVPSANAMGAPVAGTIQPGSQGPYNKNQLLERMNARAQEMRTNE